MITDGNSRKRPELHIRAAGLTDVGLVREHNEDAFLADVEGGIFIVTDGVGGHACGDVAARMVVEMLPRIIRRRIGEMSTPKADDDRAIGPSTMLRAGEMLQKSVNELSRRMYDESKDDPGSKGMGATVVVALLTARHAQIAHMGDSRAYLFRRGRLRKLTEDHSIVNLLMHNGEITAKEAQDHPARGHLTRFVGMEAEVDPDAQTIDLQPDDRLLLCTDGLWDMAPDKQLRGILAERNDPEVTCRDLLAAAKDAGGQDNLTALVVDLLDGR